MKKGPNKRSLEGKRKYNQNVKTTTLLRKSTGKRTAGGKGTGEGQENPGSGSKASLYFLGSAQGTLLVDTRKGHPEQIDQVISERVLKPTK